MPRVYLKMHTRAHTRMYAMNCENTILPPETSPADFALERQRFQLAIDEMNAAVFEWDRKSGRFYNSAAYQKYALSQVSADDILRNCGPADVVHPDDIAVLQRFFQKTNGSSKKAGETLRLKMTDGSYRWCRMTGFFFKDADGQPSRTVGIIIDVNEERERSFMLNSLLNEIPGGVGIFCFGEKLGCQYFSDGFAHLSGRTRQEIEALLQAGTLLQTCIAPVDYPSFLRALQKNAQAGKPLNITYRYVMKSGDIGWLHLSGAKMREENGVPVYYCIFTNPTDETALYRSVAEDSPSIVFVAEKGSRNVLYANSGARALAGLPSDVEGAEQSIIAVLQQQGKQLLLSNEDVDALRPDVYTEFHVSCNDRLFAVKGKALKWNGVDSYIIYASDETAEHQHQLELQKLIDEVPAGIGIYEIHGGVLSLSYLNDAYYALLGQPREERTQYLGTAAMQAAHPDSLADLRAAVQRLSEGADHASTPFRIKHGSGRWIWMNLSAAVVERKGADLKLYVAFSDCDEMMRTQQALLTRYEDQVRYSRMSSLSSIASSMVNLTTNTISQQNAKNASLTSIITHQTPQQGFESMYPLIPDEAIRKEYAAIFDSDAIRANYQKGITQQSIRHPYQTLDTWLESSYNAVRNPRTGDLEVYCSAKDVTLDELQNNVTQFLMTHAYDEAVLINPRTGEPKVLIDRAGSAVYAEQRAAKDYSQGLHNFFLKYSADEDAAQVAQSVGLAAVTSALEKQDVYTITYSLYNAEHHITHKRASYAYLNQYRTLLLCTVQDITGSFEKEAARRRALQDALAQAEAANRSKTEFFSRMSHDMRTPMNGILGLAALSEQESDPAVLRASMAQVRESGNYLLSLINDTLDFQRIESGKMRLNREIVYAKTVFESILTMIRPVAEAKGVHFQVANHNAEMDWYVYLDPVRIKQVLINLLSNAIKFTPSGGAVTLDIRCLGREGMISHNRIRVIDTGIGMSRAFLRDRLFTPFEQEQNTVTTQYAGSGLGLSIVRNLLEKMGGRIEVESVPGVGTTFSVFLDFIRVPAQTAEAALAKSRCTGAGPERELNGRHILLVEDHPLNAQIAQALLEKAGCTVQWEDNGEKGLRAFAASLPNEYDAILMDVRMPVMDGLAAARAIRALERADAARVPILAMTANAYDEDVQKSRAAGMNAHLAKPVDPQKLYEGLRRAIMERDEA